MEPNSKVKENTSESIEKESPCKNSNSQNDQSRVKNEFKLNISSQCKNGKNTIECTKPENGRELNPKNISISDHLEVNSKQANGIKQSRLHQKRVEMNKSPQDKKTKKNDNLGLESELILKDNLNFAENFNEHFYEEIQDVDNDQSNGKAIERTHETLQNQRHETSSGIAQINETSRDREVEVQKDNEITTKLVVPTRLMNELSVDTTNYSDPIYWDMKYVTEIVTYVASFYYIKFGIVPRWNPSNYDHIPQNPNVVFGEDEAEYVESTLIFNRDYYEQLFYSLIDPALLVDQSMFDFAVNVILQQHMHDYYYLSKAFQLATAIAIFAIHSSQLGFTDALYHAVISIITSVKIYRSSVRAPTRSLLTIFQGSTQITFANQI